MYEAKRLQLTPQKADLILDKLLRFESMFNDGQPACEQYCGNCPLCWQRKAAVAGNIVRSDGYAFEVWKGAEFVGIMHIRDIVAKHDAMAEMAFWDKDLRGKAGIINKTLDRAIFGELGLHRVTVEVPARMEALCKFIERKLGFQHEGVKREAMLWRGEWDDVVIYGKLANGKVK